MNFDYLNKKIIIGLSGGPDSIFLALKLLQEVGNKNLIACHVNYNYRKESINDQKLVEKFCKNNDLKLHICEFKGDYKNVKNFESFAREYRYNFFSDILKKERFDCVAIAHNLNDDVETFIMQKKRNNLPEWFGIKNVTKLNDVEIIRPILEIKKSYIVLYLNSNNIDYCIDKTNFDKKFLRNKIRSELKEEEFEKILIEKEILNNELIDLSIKINMLLSKTSKNSFNIDILLNNNPETVKRFIFEFFKKLDLDSYLTKRKHSTLNEIYKQLCSKKRNIRLQFSEIEVLKNNNVVSINKIK